jgi:hypothetical protein
LKAYLLDTNIISNVIRPAPSPALVAWLGERADEELFIASLTLAELRRGILQKSPGRRRDELERWFAGADGPPSLFRGRILSFDDRAAIVWAELMADGRARGRPRSALDMIVAAVALANGCTPVTDNERDFEGLEIINPMRVLAP